MEINVPQRRRQQKDERKERREDMARKEREAWSMSTKCLLARSPGIVLKPAK